MFKDRTLLITGGTGSFGHAVLDRFLDSDIREIRIFSRDEKKQHDMRCHYQNDKIKYYIGDVRDYSSLDKALHGVDFVFCAAALKQVPSCEFHPLEAVKTNILGVENTIESAIKNSVSNVVVLSTDKAVYPINAMGMSKALAEKVAIAWARSVCGNGPNICVTRYGNVMASRGSVIPLFVDQIKAGKSMTVTDINMTRFMMSLEDAVDLVLYAFERGNPGDLFVQKSPATTIGQLVKTLATIFDSTLEIQEIGIRHGEKMHESLLNQQEMIRAIDENEYYRIPSDMQELNYNKYFEEGQNRNVKYPAYSSDNTHQLTHSELYDMLMDLDYIQGELK